MGLLNRFWQRRTKRASKPRSTQGPRSYDLCLERLEDRSLPSTSPSTAWAQAVGDTSAPATSESYAVATDSAGSVYMTGFYTDQFLPAGSSTPLYSAGGMDIFVAKYSSTGAFQWAVSMGGAGADFGIALAADSAGHVDVAGAFSGTARFGSTTLTATGSSYNPFVAQLDANSGAVFWATNPFPTSGYWAYDVAVDSAANAYVTGVYPSASGFAAKIGPNGNLLWQDQITSPINGSSSGRHVAVSGTNVYFSGGFNDSATFATGSGNYTVTSNTSGVAAYVLNLTSNNQFVWAQVFQPLAQKHQTPGIIGITGIATDSNGNVYASGPIYGMVNFAGSTSTTGPFVLNGGSEAAYVVKLSPTGSPLWADQFGTNGAAPNSITVDGAGNVYLTGNYSGTTSFFGTRLTSDAGSSDVFVMNLTTNGAFQWVVSAGGSAADYGEGIAVDSSGNVDVAGAIDWNSASNYTAAFGTQSLKTSTAVAFVWQLTQP
jgi:hypothetical protein